MHLSQASSRANASDVPVSTEWGGQRTGRETPPRARALNTIAAIVFVLLAMWAGFVNIGLPPVVIVGGSGLVALVMWQRTYLRHPTDPSVILPLFLLTVAALDVHMAEEYLAGFGPAMSRLFDISWSERSFLLIFAFFGPSLYALTAIGLYYRVPLAGFMAWFIFIGPGVAEFTHFIFPLLKPALSPSVTSSISAYVSNGRLVADMPNYWVGATGRYYFPGLYTAVLPMIPGIYAIYRLVRRPVVRSGAQLLLNRGSEGQKTRGSRKAGKIS
jgi:hypothetical protein